MGIMSITVADLAYCAGIVDGEGSVSIHLRSKRRTYQIMVHVAMCEPNAVELLYRLFGGSLGVTKHAERENHRDQLIWQVAAIKASSCLQLLLPYLRVKRQQAINGIRLQQLNAEIRNNTTEQRRSRKGFGPANKGAFHTDPILLGECRRLFLAQRILNQRGKVAKYRKAA